jgi:hypothetical protein
MIGYPNLLINEELTIENEGENQIKPSTNKSRYQHRQYIHQWICIRDIIDGLVTCNHILKYKNINEILIKIDLWLKSKMNPTKSELTITNIKSFKAQARQLIWDLMEMK